MFEEIDSIALEVSSEESTFGDFLSSLSKEQMIYLLSLNFRFFESDYTDQSFIFDINNQVD